MGREDQGNGAGVEYGAPNNGLLLKLADGQGDSRQRAARAVERVADPAHRPALEVTVFRLREGVVLFLGGCAS